MYQDSVATNHVIVNSRNIVNHSIGKGNFSFSAANGCPLEVLKSRNFDFNSNQSRFKMNAIYSSFDEGGFLTNVQPKTSQ